MDGLLQNAEAHSPAVYLDCFASSYELTIPLADAVTSVAPHIPLKDILSVLQMLWMARLDDYLSMEKTWAKDMLQSLCKKWQRNVSLLYSNSSKPL